MRLPNSVIIQLYDIIDGYLVEERFAEIDRVLVYLKNSQFPVELLIAALTATLSAKSKLEEREPFLEAVRARLVSSGLDSDKVLVGL